MLDVLAAFADLQPAPRSDAPLELTPVAPDLFESDEDDDGDDQATSPTARRSD